MDIILGGLELVSAVVTLAGPMGAMAGTVLTMISSVLGIFGGTSGILTFYIKQTLRK